MIKILPILKKLISILILLSVFLLFEETYTIAWVVDDSNNEEITVRGIRDYAPGRLIVKFKNDISKKDLEQIQSETGVRFKEKIQGVNIHIVELPESANEEAYLHVFRNKKYVEFAELDYIVPPEEVVPNDPWYIDEWHLKKIKAPNAWSYSTGSNNIIIAILDTGVESFHPDLASKLVPGWNAYDNNDNTSDVIGHGTAVAGVASAGTNNFNGVASISWNSMIMPVRISDPQGYASYSTAAKGLIWAADHGARVANISYQMSDSLTIADAAKYFQDKGGVVTISAGNNKTFISANDNPYVLTVTATDSNDLLASFTNTGNNVDIAAPGSIIYTTATNGTYKAFSGTSFSAPIVAGVAALVFSINPNLSGLEVQEILKSSADDIGPIGWDTGYGWGRINAEKAIMMALDSSSELDQSPPTVKFIYPLSDLVLTGTVNVEIDATDNTGIAFVSFYIDGNLHYTFTSKPYIYLLDTTQLSDGIHVFEAFAYDEAGNVSNASISVTVKNTFSYIDTIAPFIDIVSPQDGTTISTKFLNIIVNTSDNVGVLKIELYVDNKLTASSNIYPFTIKINTKTLSKGIHKIYCKAYDGAGNLGVSKVVNIYK